MGGNDTLFPLVNFGVVTFTNAEATSLAGIYTPANAIIGDIKQNNQNFTSVSTNGSSVTIQFV